MFTGIIESEGTILELTKKGNDIALTISYDQKIFDDIHDGDSISVNGICLTIEQFSKDKLKFHLSMESISKVAKFTLDQKVNLERSLKLNDRISGHFVFGHVDGIALIENIEKLNDCEKWDVKVPSNLNKYIAKFKNDISEVIENDEISEVWLNTKLSLFDNKSPLEASKYKKYKKKIEEVLKDIDLIHESRLSEDEPGMDPNYIRERLNIN